MGAEVSYAGSEIMTQMHENFASPFDAVYVLVIKKVLCAQDTYTGSRDCATLLS